MKTLSGLTAALLLSAYCCTALASGADEANREFIRQQESFSQQLRGQDNAPLRPLSATLTPQKSLPHGATSIVLYSRPRAVNTGRSSDTVQRP